MTELIIALLRNRDGFHPVVPFDPQTDRLVKFDFSVENTTLDPAIFNATENFCRYVDQELSSHHAKYGIGGYAEYRNVYSASRVFDAEQEGQEPRRFHLGLDIWGPAGTVVTAPLGGMVHSLANNDRAGDYGATIVLLHQMEGIPFYSLYGHLSLKDLVLSEGDYINRGQPFAHFGEPAENGHWPPHLHLQVILDMEMRQGDYPGVCRYSERERYLANCPDPDLLVNLNRFVHC
jgi:murein DD-endopeptidase MepM/ murein hydrolase activator NlpD